MKITLNDKMWKEFYLKDIFPIIKRGRRLKKNDHIKGEIPYVSSTALNNGVDGFLGNTKGVRMFSNCCTIANSGSVGVCFYQPNTFVASDHVTQMKNVRFNHYIYLFISTVASRLSEKYSFNREMNDNRIMREVIMLPIDNKGNPDYNFMEQYMRDVEIEKVRLFKKSISVRIAELSSPEKITPLDHKKWSEFKIEHLFDIEKCKCSNVSLLYKGNTPYVGATNRNNGIVKFVENRANLITKGNCIAFICDGEGSIGYSVYKSEDFIGSTTVKVGRNEHLNGYTGLFITTIADKVRGKYNFGFKRTEEHLKKEIIIIPVNSTDEPDYEYMEQYMKQIERNQLIGYINFIDNK